MNYGAALSAPPPTHTHTHNPLLQEHAYTFLSKTYLVKPVIKWHNIVAILYLYVSPTKRGLQQQ